MAVKGNCLKNQYNQYNAYVDEHGQEKKRQTVCIVWREVNTPNTRNNLGKSDLGWDAVYFYKHT